MKNLKTLLAAGAMLAAGAVQAQNYVPVQGAPGSGPAVYLPAEPVAAPTTANTVTVLTYERNVAVGDMSSGLTGRMRSWAMNKLEPAEIDPESDGSMGVKTLAFVVINEEGLTGQGVNEFVSFNAELSVTGGAVVMKATDLVYHRTGAGMQPVDVPLSEAGAAQTRFEHRFDNLMNDMERTARRDMGTARR